jgi:hypothetical protein
MLRSLHPEMPQTMCIVKRLLLQVRVVWRQLDAERYLAAKEKFSQE